MIGKSARGKENGRAWHGACAFIFSLEAAFSLALVVIAAAYLPFFMQQKENVGTFLSCADAAEAMSETRAFSSQAALDRAVGEISALYDGCIFAQAHGMETLQCRGIENDSGGGREIFSFTFPVWSEGRLKNAQAGCIE
jgi:hypothetical protein